MGFITPDPSPEDIRDIGRCLNWLQSHRIEQDLFGDAMSRYKEFVRRKAREYWDEMVRTGSLDAVDATGASSRTPQTGTLHETLGSLAAFPFFMLAAE